MSHTPGPWKWIDYGGYYRLVGNDGEFVADDGSACAEYRPQIDINSANARLIAAAPELVEALRALFGYISDGTLVRDTSRDSEPGWAMRMWAMRMLPFVADLKRAESILAKLDGGK